MESWKTVATYLDLPSAHIAKAKLESEGVECFLKDEHSIGINPLSSAALGGIKLQVRESDFAEAIKILNRTH